MNTRLKTLIHSLTTLALIPAWLLSADVPQIDALRIFDPSKDTGGLKNQVLELLRSDASLADEIMAVALDDNATLNGRELACKILMGAPLPENGVELAKLLTYPELSHPVRLVLSPIQGENIDAAFIEALPLCNGQFQHGIIASLADRKTSAAVDPLIELAETSDDFAITAHCLSAIAKIGGKDAVSFLSNLPITEWSSVHIAYGEAIIQLLDTNADQISTATRKKLAKALLHKQYPAEIRFAGLSESLKLKSTDYRLVLSFLQSDDVQLQEAGATAIPMLDQKVVGKLLKDANKLDIAPRIQLIKGLASLNISETLGYARNTLKTATDASLRQTCYSVIGKLGTVKDAEQIAGEILAAGKEEQEWMREAIVTIPDNEVDSWLLESFKTNEEPMQKLVLELITQRGLRNSIPALFAQLDNVPSSVKKATYKTIGQLGTLTDIKSLYEKRSQETKGNRNTLDRAIVDISRRIPSDAGTDFLVSQYGALSKEEQPQLLKMIGAIGNESSLAFVIPLLDQAEPNPIALRSILTWRDNNAFGQLGIMSKRESLSDANRMKCWNALFRLTIGALETWEKQRIAFIQLSFDAAPSDAAVAKLLSTLGDYQRGDVLEWLGEGRTHPKYGEAFTNTYNALAKSMDI